MLAQYFVRFQNARLVLRFQNALRLHCIMCVSQKRTISAAFSQYHLKRMTSATFPKRTASAAF